MSFARISLKTWYRLHKWTSLVCTIFLFLICLTGLPLVFEDEINGLLSIDPPYAALPADTPMANLDRLTHTARQRYPGQVVSSVFIDDDEPQVLVTLAPQIGSPREQLHSMKFDARNGQVLKDEPPLGHQPQTFMGVMFSLHTDLFAGLGGALFLGLMGLLFVTATVSGVVLYGPFMKKLPFGTVRAERARRLKWLDLHNLLGIVTLAWVLVVGLTGVINELSAPLFALWQQTDVKAMLGVSEGRPAPSDDRLSSAQAAYDTAARALPGMNLTSVVFPGNRFGSPYHYLIWAKGNSPLTRRLFSPVLVDATTGSLSAVVRMPWYLRALEVSRPLHFGDYGGPPLKILWVSLDVITLLVLGSGLYLWFARRAANDNRLETLIAARS
jgi:uncharacterized iron-regulated membrane protein